MTDAPHDAAAVAEAVGNRRVVALACTHAHDDHLRVAPALAERTNAPIFDAPRRPGPVGPGAQRPRAGRAWCVVVGCHCAFPFVPVVPVVAVAGVRPGVLRAAVWDSTHGDLVLCPTLDVPDRSRRNVWSLFEYGPNSTGPERNSGRAPRMETRPFRTSEVCPPSDRCGPDDADSTRATGLTARQDERWAGPHHSGGAGVDFSGAGMPPW